MRALVGTAAIALSLVVAHGRGPDPSALTRLQDFAAERVSSNNPDPESNDDSWRPIAGETVTIADLTGPGVVTHLWITVAANEYGWPRLLRLRAYYDGSAIPSVSRASQRGGRVGQLRPTCGARVTDLDRAGADSTGRVVGTCCHTQDQHALTSRRWRSHAAPKTV